MLENPELLYKYAARKPDLEKILKKYMHVYDPKSTTSRAVAWKAKALRSGKKYKFGIRVPLSVKEAMAIDKENGDTLWGDSIGKELGQFKDYITFKVLKKGEKPPPGYIVVPYHIVF